MSDATELLALREKVAARIADAKIVQGNMRSELQYLFGPLQANVLLGMVAYTIDQDETILAILDSLIWEAENAGQ